MELVRVPEAYKVLVENISGFERINFSGILAHDLQQASVYKGQWGFVER